MRPEGLRCLRCDLELPAGRTFGGCPRCRNQNHPTNLSVVYDETALARAVNQSRDSSKAPGMWRYRQLLPVDDEDSIVTLGEGDTPLLRVDRIGQKLGIRNLYVKDESRNPTGSFKDRLASAAISVALRLGMKVITGSSSGNAGAATAAFSASAGLPCVMFTTQQFPLAMKTQMAVLGTYLLAAPTIIDRWALVEAGVDQLGWFPVTVFSHPYFGSNCYGIEGYKTIGYEVADILGDDIDHIVVPVGAGDAFTGIWKGFKEYAQGGLLDEVPRMHAAEIYGPLEHALANDLEDCIEMPTEGDPSVAVSVASNLSTYQALNVLRDTGGGARSATNEELLQTQHDLARLEGIYVETSSALSIAAIPRMVEAGLIDPDSTVVAVLTSSGLKHPEITDAYLPPIPSTTNLFEDALTVLEQVYGFDAIGHKTVEMSNGGDS